MQTMFIELELHAYILDRAGVIVNWIVRIRLYRTRGADMKTDVGADLVALVLGRCVARP